MQHEPFTTEWHRVLKAGWQECKLVDGRPGTGVLLQAVYFVMLARLLGASSMNLWGAFALTALVAQYAPLEREQFFCAMCRANTALSRLLGKPVSVTVSMGIMLTIALHLLGPHLLNPKVRPCTFGGYSQLSFAQLTAETARVFQAFDNLKLLRG